MIWIVIIGFIIALIASPVFRCGFSHPFWTVGYALVDAFNYIRYRKWNECPTGEILGFVGLFSKGKTLSLVYNIVCTLYLKYDGKKVYDRGRKKFVTQRIHIISNVDLSVPFSKFVSMEQVVRAAEDRKAYDDEHDTRTVTIILGDEFSVQMNSREFKSNFNAQLLNTILTCRHHYISLYYSAQRFNHVDALLRQVTSYVVDCEKLWRFQKNYYYDAWDMENATNVQLINPVRRKVWFIRNKDFNRYDTLACVGNLIKQWKAGDMMTEEEILALQQPGTGTVGMEGVINFSRKFKKAKKKLK